VERSDVDLAVVVEYCYSQVELEGHLVVTETAAVSLKAVISTWKMEAVVAYEVVELLESSLQSFGVVEVAVVESENRWHYL